MLRSQSRSVVSQKRPVFTCSLCATRPIALRRDLHNSSKQSDSQFAQRQLPRREPSRDIQRIIRGATGTGAGQPLPPKKWGSLVRKPESQAPMPSGPGAPVRGPGAWGSVHQGGYDARQQSGGGYGRLEGSGIIRRSPSTSSYKGTSMNVPGSASGGAVPMFGGAGRMEKSWKPPADPSPTRTTSPVVSNIIRPGDRTPVRRPFDEPRLTRPSENASPIRRPFDDPQLTRPYDSEQRIPFDPPPRDLFSNQQSEPQRKKKPWEVEDTSARRTPTASRFGRDVEEIDIPVIREDTADPRFQKKVAARERDRARNRREFVDDEVAILDENQGISVKELKKLKKQKKREAVRALIPIMLPQFISVENLATRLNVPLKKFEKQLQQMGFDETNGDLILNAENAGLIAGELGYEVIVDRSEELDIKPRPPPEDKSLLPQRPPVVTIMGHVDHGKTTLLDWLRKSSIVDTEHGGITQHIGAFSVTMASGKVITFLDTPGHAAFLSMRERGANVTDIVILVVAADDSVKPQTIEAIKHAKAAEVPIIVAINKCDKDGANVDKVKHDLANHDVVVEDFGGDTQVVCVSGKTGLGMEELEEATVTLGEILDHRAEADGQVEGWILEATTKKRGRVATVLVTRGTLKPGDIMVAGRTWTKIRTLTNEHGEEVAFAGPGQPVEVDGWKDQPEAGEAVLQAENEDRAKRAVDYRTEKFERIQQAIDMEAINTARRLQREKEEREEAIRAAAIEAGEDPEQAIIDAQRELERNAQTTQEVPFIIKADVDGSVEACVEALQGIGNNEVKTKIIRSAFGEVSEFDVDHAAAAGAYIVSFNLPTDPQIFQYARYRKVQILAHNIIYRLAAEVTEKVQDRLPPRVTTNVTGEAELLQIFQYTIKGRKQRPYAGCKVLNGTISKNAKVRVLRGPEGKKEVVFDGSLESLKNVKKDVQEMKRGQECGMGFAGWTEFQEGDHIQCYETLEEKRYL